ncbi:MAG: polysaccharide lyase 6 family protein [Pirellulaceae bacterium]
MNVTLTSKGILCAASRFSWRSAAMGTMAVATFLAAHAASAKDHMVTPETDLKKLCKEIVAGDELVLSNGVWSDASLTFEQLSGSESAPITIRAQSPGKVVLTGKSEFRLSGTHIIVAGFVFNNTDSSDVLETRTHSERHAHHCRITECAFQQSADGPAGEESRWLSLYGTDNRVDHCRFEGKRSRGTTLVVWVGDQPNRHHIDFNYFGHRPELGRNGGETIRIGTSEVSEKESQTVVTDNLFERCNGESEIVSNKSCGNLYRHNVFVECAGALTLRHGHRCLVDANVFLGNKKNGTGGVRIVGSKHVVTNNYFANLRGDEMRAALSMMNAPTNGKLNEYAPVREAVVSHNTFIDCKVSMEIGVEASEKLSIAPAECRISHNLFAAGKWPLFRIDAEPVDFSWAENVCLVDVKSPDPPTQVRAIQCQLQADENQLMRPVFANELRSEINSGITEDIDGGSRQTESIFGCDDPATPPRKWVGPQNTGPSTWK